jgi:hypothetical protein
MRHDSEVADSSEALQWLLDWYAAQCNGEWEHGYGIHIESLDNPGFYIKIDLRETDLEGRTFVTTKCGDGPGTDDPQERWYHCEVKEGVFLGAGGIYSLLTIINVFRHWATSTS